MREFLGSPVVRTLELSLGPGLIPSQGTKIQKLYGATKKTQKLMHMSMQYGQCAFLNLASSDLHTTDEKLGNSARERGGV